MNLSNSIRASLYISHISNMSDLVIRSSMSLSMWVEVRTSSLASFDQVSKLMNMEPVMAWSESSDLSKNSDLLTLLLDELDDGGNIMSSHLLLVEEPEILMLWVQGHMLPAVLVSSVVS